MIFHRQFKFYAAHRNQLLKDKCASLHGHKYEVQFDLEVKRGSGGRGNDITALFSDFDQIGESIRGKVDHSTLLDWNDPLGEVLENFRLSSPCGTFWKLTYFPFPTSAENLSFAIFHQILTHLERFELGRLQNISLRETDSTLIHYDYTTYKEDYKSFIARKVNEGWPLMNVISNQTLQNLRKFSNECPASRAPVEF